jgi:hypothetical protein
MLAYTDLLTFYPRAAIHGAIARGVVGVITAGSASPLKNRKKIRKKCNFYKGLKF